MREQVREHEEKTSEAIVIFVTCSLRISLRGRDALVGDPIVKGGSVIEFVQRITVHFSVEIYFLNMRCAL